MPDPKSRTEGHIKLKIGTMDARDTGNPLSHLEVERSKVKAWRVGLWHGVPALPTFTIRSIGHLVNDGEVDD